jgi:CrcB protein
VQALYLFIAGGLGALGRYGLSGLAQRIGAGFPWGTLAVNVLGSLTLGFIMQIGLSTDVIPREVRIAATVGFLGAFTTFSTFSFETARYLEDGVWSTGLLNIISNVVLCIAAALLGMFLGRTATGGA